MTSSPCSGGVVTVAGLLNCMPPCRPVVRRPLLLLAVVVRHVHHCPHPHALVCPRPLALAGLACVPLAPCRRRQRRPLSPTLTTTIAAAAHSTTTTARSQRLSFVIDGSDGVHRRLRRQLMAAAAMASLPPPSTTMVSAVGSIPPLPPSTTTFVDEDRHRRRRHRPPPQSTMTAIATIKDVDWRRRLHHTAASVNDDHRQGRPACQRTLGRRHHCRARPPLSPLCRRGT